MTYRPTEFQVNNSGGIECDISIDPETLDGGTMFFHIEQDSESITVSLECLENLLACANELLQAWRETRAYADAACAMRTTQPSTAAQETQEPVAWYVTGCGRLLDEDEAKAEARHIGGTARAIPLYTAPQAQAGAVPMSHEDAKALVLKYGIDPLHLVLQVERHHGITGGQHGADTRSD